MSTMTHARAMQLVDRLARILRDEIAAIGRGELAEVEALFPRKQALLAEIEAAFADPAPLLEGDTPPAVRLRERLAELQRLIRTDLALLQRMTEATGAVAREIERIRERHGLSGLYDKDGTPRTAPVAGAQRFDTSL
ncbi:hypothetical protein [Pseudooceanicola nanhaiensis]|jgi:hypothetical protein|uniref:hypothetical protein n=1 Tax=Pseudooceanicola nanhaiensis TaxID=375761 RepID=UPI00300A230A